MTENRAFRQQQYAARRDADYDNALAREAELGKAAKEEFAATAALETARWREARAARAAEGAARRHEMASGVAHELVSEDAPTPQSPVCEQRFTSPASLNAPSFRGRCLFPVVCKGAAIHACRRIHLPPSR